MAIVSVAAFVALGVLHYKVRETWVTVANAIVVAACVTIPMTHLFALSREKEQRAFTIAREQEQRRAALRQAHLERLRRTLLTDFLKLKGVAEQIASNGGRFTDLSKDVGANKIELENAFYADPLSRDIANHFATYHEQKERLRAQVEQQDQEDREATRLVTSMLPREPAVYRQEIARSILSNCRGRGGMRLDDTGTSYTFAWAGFGGGGSGGTGRPGRELVEAYEVYKVFRPNADVLARCSRLKVREADVVDAARRLSQEAQMLAERPTLSGDCNFTKPPE
jgi:hypothetical protein